MVGYGPCPGLPLLDCMSFSSPRVLNLLVLPLSPSVHSHDSSLAGIYPVEVPAQVPDPAAARAIVDLFIQRHRPRRPDDFSFQVFDGERVLKEQDEPVCDVEVRLGGRTGRTAAG